MSSPCWIGCFYSTALGPDAGTPGGAIAGVPLQTLLDAWNRPFLPEAEGGCPALPKMTPWFEKVAPEEWDDEVVDEKAQPVEEKA